MNNDVFIEIAHNLAMLADIVDLLQVNKSIYQTLIQHFHMNTKSPLEWSMRSLHLFPNEINLIILKSPYTNFHFNGLFTWVECLYPIHLLFPSHLSIGLYLHMYLLDILARM